MYLFEIYKDHKLEYRWRFKAPNGAIIAVSSESYTTKENCQYSIHLVKSYAAQATVYDLTVAQSIYR